ncbi:EPM2AIP1 [Cordylochernes scorpioides]|uniref:EPM2AIP1 n=1 Tax=Cordylochernes scorpioides TaxID=51811 RepID=A0ABY6K7K4_9ARAC|nr:EPM2AIP1 [Cordylochernes scorpioides]
MKRHYKTKHSQNYSKYTGIVRTEKFEALKRGLKSQQSLFTKVKTEQEAATRASFRVALEIAKRGKPFTDGEMIKECIIAVVEEMCPEKVNLLKTVSMSANTVARRVENIAENISSQLFDKNGHVEWFSLALDESTDVLDTAQVLIYIRGVDKSYEVHEELLDMYSIHGTTTGTDIFKGVEMAINKNNLRWKNLKCITTDGGKNMSGKDKGVVALVSKAVENDGGSKPLVLHCIIHQQSLCGKCLDMSDVLKPVISTVNFIRSFGLNHRQFRQFIAEIGETDLPYHTAVRWLSCGKVLQRFFELRAVIEFFFNEKHRPLTELQNNAWLWKLAFYVYLTKHVNELNLRLQGENQHLPDLYTNIKSFRMKLILFQSQLRNYLLNLRNGTFSSLIRSFSFSEVFTKVRKRTRARSGNVVVSKEEPQMWQKISGCLRGGVEEQRMPPTQQFLKTDYFRSDMVAEKAQRIYYKSNKKNEAAIRRSVRSGTNLSSKISSYSRGTLIEKTEKALVIWIEDLTQKRIPLDGHLIKMKALKFYKELKESEPSTSSRESNPQFSASTGWLTGFIKIHSFHNLKIKGEVASADEEAARKYPEKLAKIIKDGGYCAHQIFNADETGLFWKKMPTRTYIAKSEKNASGFKAAKDRVTLLLCSNASGDRMLKPLLVNRSLKPRALKGKDLNTLPVHWMANKKAWVTTAIFTEWFNKCFVPEVENYMKEMGLEFKILLILDNAPGHPNLEHPNIKVVFFPPNTTSLIQPLDQGIISAFKKYYVKFTFQFIFDKLESDTITVTEVWKQFNILNCVDYVALAIAEIKSQTLNACWKAAWPECVSKRNESNRTTIVTSNIISIAKEIGGEGFDDFGEHDIEELLVDEALNDDDILESMVDTTKDFETV